MLDVPSVEDYHHIKTKSQTEFKRQGEMIITVYLADLAVPEVLLNGELFGEAHTSHQTVDCAH